MSTSASARFRVSVRTWSAWLGSATPEGWLCARITATGVVPEDALDDFPRG